MVTWLHDDGDVIRYLLELYCKFFILFGKICYGKIVFLARVDADTIDNIAGKDEIFDSSGNFSLSAVAKSSIDPFKKSIPLIFHKGVAADMDV